MAMMMCASMPPSFSTNDTSMRERGNEAQRINKRKAKIVPKGCSVFIIEGQKIIALNQKSAQVKFDKMKK